MIGSPSIVHPDAISREAEYTSVQTDTAIIPGVAGVRIVVTQIQVLADNANSVSPGVRIGFGAATTPTTIGVVLSHPGIAAGSGVSRGIGLPLATSAPGEALRITSGAPTGGSLRVLVSSYSVPA